ncbi:hypothetical protein ACWCQ1_41160 [Streptomyces sp. NPDC002144]
MADGNFERATSWAFSGGHSARAIWNTAESGEFVRVDRLGEIEETIRFECASDGTLMASAFDADMDLRRTTKSQFLPGGMVVAASDDSPGPSSTTTTGTVQVGSSKIDIRVEVQSDRTVHITMNGSDPAGSTLASDQTIRSDGSGAFSQISKSPAGAGTTVTVSAAGEFTPAGGTGFQTIEAKDNATGLSVSDTTGINSAGEDFERSGVADGNGNESMTTVTWHADGGATITTVSKDSDGEVSVESGDIDKDGNPVSSSPEGGSSGSDSTGTSGSDGTGTSGDESGGPGGGESGETGGEMPSGDGTDEGPPSIGFGKSQSVFGDGFGSPFRPGLGGNRNGGNGFGEGIDPAELGRILVGDVEDGGEALGEPGGPTGRLVSDSNRHPAGTVAVEDWGETTDPRVLIATVGFVAGSQAATIAEQARQQM